MRVVSYEVNGVDYDQDRLSYHGGAAVPYLSGQTSPNGVDPVHFFDMHTIEGESALTGECAIPNSTYAYKYQVPYTWTETSYDEENWGENITTTAPVYCCCALELLCGCDDFHKNRSFVPALVQNYDFFRRGKTVPQNSSSLCVVDYQGKTALLVDGTLENGSTKADPNASYPTQTLTTMMPEICSLIASRGQTYAPSSAAFVAVWTAVVSLGSMLGMCFVFL